MIFAKTQLLKLPLPYNSFIITEIIITETGTAGVLEVKENLLVGLTVSAPNEFQSSTSSVFEVMLARYYFREGSHTHISISAKDVDYSSTSLN